MICKTVEKKSTFKLVAWPNINYCKYCEDPAQKSLGVNSIELLKMFSKIFFEILVLENLIVKYFLVLKSQKHFQAVFQ